MIPKKNFGTAPLNYTPGRGRGAVGFITRSDIGPAKVEIEEPPEDFNDYDEWNGYQQPLFNGGDYDEEDREADQTYNFVDKKMEQRRVQKKLLSEKPSLVNQFSDLKRDLAKLSKEDWMAIPEIGDYSIKKKKQDRITAAPDSLILNEIGEARGTLLSLRLDKMGDNVAGQSVVDTKGYLTNLQSQIPQFQDIGDFKKARLLLKSVIQTDPKGSFGWVAAARVEELDGKIQAAKNILSQGLQKAEDTEDIWIELARLETAEKSKQILSKAVQLLPHSIKLWLSYVQKENDQQTKCKILKRALEYVPNSVDLWKELIGQSSEQEAKVLLHKAVECVPKNLSFWLALAKLETYENAKSVLNKARQCLPQEPTIWIHAAKLEESAGKDKQQVTIVLQKGIKVLQKNGFRIMKDEWLQEAELAERTQNFFTCFAIVSALPQLTQADANLYEQKGSIITARSIYQNIQEKTYEMFKEYINFEKQYGEVEIAIKSALKIFPVEEFWLEAIDFVKDEIEYPKTERILLKLGKIEYKKNNNLEKQYQHYNRTKEYYLEATKVGGELSWVKYFKLLAKLGENLDNIEQILEKYPKSEKLWVLYAQHQNDILRSRKLFDLAIEKLPTLFIWKSYIEFEIKNQSFSRGRPLIDKAKQLYPKNPELWVLAIHLEIDCGNRKAAQFLLNKALQECPRHGELWALAIELEPKNTRKKKSANAVTLCGDDPHVYISTAKIFIKEGKYEKAKKWLEKALILSPQLGDAWAYLKILDKDIVPQNPKLGRLWKQSGKRIDQAVKLALNEIQKID